MIPDEVLEARGYNRFTAAGMSHADRGFQKRFRDAGGKTLYFLNFYQFPEFSGMPGSTSAESHFYQDEEVGHWIIAKMHDCDDIDRAERFFQDFYGKMGMVPDIHNNDGED